MSRHYHDKGEKKSIPRLHPKPGPEAIARLKLQILQAWRHRLAKVRKPELKGRATKDFINLYNTGILLPEGFTSPKHISISTLYNWNKAEKGGGVKGLIPKYRDRKELADSIIPILPTYKKIVIPGNPGLKFRERIFLPKIREQWEWPPLRCPLMLVMRFFMAVPKGRSMRERIKCLNHERAHLSMPHLDKLIAFAKNCLRGIVYENDRQIIVLHAEKHFEWVFEDSKSEIFIRQIKG